MEELKVGTKTYQYCALTNFKNSLLWLLHLLVFTVSHSYRFFLSQNYSFSFWTYIKIQHPQQLTKIFVHLWNILLFTLCLESTAPHSLTAASKETGYSEDPLDLLEIPPSTDVFSILCTINQNQKPRTLTSMS